MLGTGTKKISAKHRILRALAETEPLFRIRVVSGFDIDLGAGLDFSLAAGSIAHGTTENQRISGVSLDATTNSDTYIYADLMENCLEFIVVDNGDPPPFTAPNHWMILYALVTDGTTFTDALDFRDYGHFGADVIHAGNIAADAVDGTSIGINVDGELEFIGTTGSGTSAINFAMDSTWGDGRTTGTVESLTGTIYIPSGTYSLRTTIGCVNTGHAASLKIRKESDGTLIDTFGGAAGGLTVVTDTLVIASSEEYDIFGVCDVSAGVGLVKGFYLEV